MNRISSIMVLKTMITNLQRDINLKIKVNKAQKRKRKRRLNRPTRAPLMCFKASMAWQAIDRDVTRRAEAERKWLEM